MLEGEKHNERREMGKVEKRERKRNDVYILHIRGRSWPKATKIIKRLI